ncbi:NADH-ubiquinone oxidoreductase-F iron-sulfur binding region domain-containing protein [Couchioplanes azureus]|uniref:NADH-ubiquinone oxidoreductase-F iron-sulfur binding region domain-containing protein n=1 Tax=Couchioplanes caeruleus TaxID=56438 RepID=UPI00166F6E6E|nr:NADH-ubiquinone oxidoreductase-F iron-sulfur binding region domain-containing protein [Couchioplanes caeruleus]GGQ75365.1 NADH dehydrogenase [Couchioplanes caeruleus subsp. azureus]
MTEPSILVGGTGHLLGPEPYAVENLATYRARGGYRTGPSPEELLGLVDAAGLLGRGGAAFPLAVKLRAVRERPGPRVVVANGAEGEPGSVKDRHLMRARPHLVLDGLRRACEVTGAGAGHLYVADPVAAGRLRAALAAAPPPVPIAVTGAPAAYVAGEESAAVRFLGGGPALPTAKPPRVFEHGVGGAPTLVANVETLAHLALLAAGRPAAGDLLITVAGAGHPPLLAEVPLGTPLRTLFPRSAAVSGALVGGLFGGLLDAGVLDLPLTPQAYAAAGGALGCGAIRLLGPDDCPVAVAAEAVGHLAAQSARQCGVCVSGTRGLAGALTALATGPDPAAGRLADLSRWSASLPGRGACGLLDAAARVAGSLVRVHGALAERHAERPCPACHARPPAAGDRLLVPPTEPYLPEGAR